MCVADVVGAVHYCDRSVVLELDFTLLEQVGEDISGVLVVECVLLRLGELLLQLLDLVLLLVLEHIRELLNLHLFFHFRLSAASLRAHLQEVSTGTMVSYKK